MDAYGEKVRRYIREKEIVCEFLCFKQTCHTVEDSAKAANTSAENIVKNVCMISREDKTVVAVIKGDAKVDMKKVSMLLGSAVRLAKGDEVLERTGYLAGGVPSFGFDAIFLIDQKVMKREIIYTGAGAENCLLKISPSELHKANKGILAQIGK